METSIFGENARQENIMIREKLKDEFNEKQWKEIQLSEPSVFTRVQSEILQGLMCDADKFEKHFHSFYTNHVQLYHWYLLDEKNYQKMGDYVFRKLLNKKIEEDEE